MAFQISASSSKSLCSANCNGQITVNIDALNPGTAPYLIEVKDSLGATVFTVTGTYQLTTYFRNVCPGDYTVEVTDATMAKRVANVTVGASEYAALTISLDKQNPSDYQASDGWIRARVTGGRGIYKFRWSNGSTDDVIANLPMGNYSVMVEDIGGGCRAAAHANLVGKIAVSISTYAQKLHRAKCCAAHIEYLAAVAKTAGSSKYECLRKKAELISGLIKILCKQMV